MRERLRVVFSKKGALAYLSQLDLQRTVERAVRRSGLPVAFTQGFHPRVRLSFSRASPVGVEVDRAWFEFGLEESVPLEVVRGALAEAFPPELEVVGVGPPSPGKPEGPRRVEVRPRSGDFGGGSGGEAGLLESTLSEALAGRAEVLRAEPDRLVIELKPDAGLAEIRRALEARLQGGACRGLRLRVLATEQENSS